ncbi:MAG: hypothetical protein LQ344_002093 [Seirophora lacunosa]|nr:MAG: hypothetical protein LQ344_002093 [Seirophora lacunosa]
MPSAVQPPKSILKSSSTGSRNASTPRTPPSEKRNRQAALHHAHLLQYRKDIEARNLSSTETLLDLPSSPLVTSTQPSAADVHTAKDALRTFQPSDFDALVEERNIDRRCGYIFCSRSNRRQDRSGQYRIITGKREIDFKVVDPKELGRWCSDECGKMALYLRVQLSEEPAWTRDWQADKLLELYNEKEERRAKGQDIGQSIPSIVVTAEEGRRETMQQRMKDLAVERGDKTNIDRVSTKVAIRFKENEQAGHRTPQPPSTENSEEGAIEGYVPRGKNAAELLSEQQEEDATDILHTIRRTHDCIAGFEAQGYPLSDRSTQVREGTSSSVVVKLDHLTA